MDAVADLEPDRLLALLWRHSADEPTGRRGPRPRLSTDAVVAAAIVLADAEGLPALSLRKVAEAVGTKVMSLYTYVPGRDELIALMTDQVLGEQPLPAYGESVRDRLQALAEVAWRDYQRHPWLLHLPGARPVLGPNACDRYEWQLGAIEGCGFDDVTMDQIVAAVDVFTAGAARAADDLRTVHEQSPLTDREWWEVNAPVLAQVIDGSRYPLGGRVGQAAGEAYDGPIDPERTFRFGLDRLLDGILDSVS